MFNVRAIFLLLANLCLVFMLVSMTGCAAATLASAGTLAGTIGTAVTTGADVYHLGKLDSVELVRIQNMIEAVHLTATDLNLAIISEEQSGHGNWMLWLSDDEGTTFQIKLDSRTETMCRCRVDMGWFGSEPTARLVLFRIRAHVPKVPEIVETPTSLPAWPEDPRGAVDSDERQHVRKPK